MLDLLPEFSSVFVQNTLLVLILGEFLLGGSLLFLFIQERKINEKLRIFFTGKSPQNLEQVLLNQSAEVRELDQEIQELFEISNKLRELCLKSLQKTSVVRFNPFKEVGGNQSFSFVVLDGKNSGAILSSLHTRESTRVYAKPVLLGDADGFPFTEEEKKAVQQAINGKPTTI